MFGLPYAALYIVFFAGSLIYAFVESLRSPLTGALSGFGNYRSALGLSEFWQSMERMTLFTAVQVTIMLAIAISLALLLDSKYCRGRRVFSLLYFLPYAVPGVVATVMWAFILSPQTDSLLAVLHMDPIQGSGIFYIIVLIVCWEWTGYNMTLYLAGLTSIATELVDAARMDGAGEVRIAWHVKLPGIRRVLFFTIVASLVGTFQLFNEPQIISFIHPLPANYTPNLLIYNTAFSYGNVPLATAESLLLALITVSFGAALVVGSRLLLRARNGPRMRGSGAV